MTQKRHLISKNIVNHLLLQLTAVKGRVMVFNVIFNNSSVLSGWPVLFVEETRVPWENHILVASHWQIYHIMLYPVHLTRVGFEFTRLVVTGTDCIQKNVGSCNSNYHTITTMMAPSNNNWYSCIYFYYN